ncbi:hypothetical protein [Serratia odorifera]|jgi:hypothetical protein|uniref:Uncharacterized protein n=2 Tax=Serratia odorifera TaxID=618 RepID=D4E2Y7_SEROD|nr:hypothetical protein [Serratia odorifera]EFE95901.1 hypothetical protein HMPREF0758_2537 [Serratia odorifera DSM 4582]MBJ2066375.1 hypothetical protein [Serratia odorifera]PNK90473.1 hypothetical protein CEQ31_012615 [Serratia odorifera]RII71581.1 hypothetical protein DX901_13715 [Serratia odorifera]VDZ59441.1 Uncharacterised protein [Serratia odorifera]
MKIAMVSLSLSLFMLANPVFSAERCEPFNKPVNAENTPAYQRLIQKSLTEKIALKSIDITQVQGDKDWLVIYAATEVADPGAFFFKNNQFVDVWGGQPDLSEKEQVIKWTRGLHVPDSLAQCFFDTVAIDE